MLPVAYSSTILPFTKGVVDLTCKNCAMADYCFSFPTTYIKISLNHFSIRKNLQTKYSPIVNKNLHKSTKYFQKHAKILSEFLKVRTNCRNPSTNLTCGLGMTCKRRTFWRNETGFTFGSRFVAIQMLET